ncbi:BCCT family transporter [Alkalicoccus chagannorensis]|uniref:BCCT family transporter n=1 Tax=Alkalicoccus chagannorensis TaxID=427072 RepID=UPI001FE0F0BD|nr:BCCT family transporter [Alkalicoccus chagannorensis]
MSRLRAYWESHHIFFLSAALIAALVVWGAVDPSGMTGVMEFFMLEMIEQFGWFYVLATAVFVGFCLFLGFGPYRHMKLGHKEEQPEYSYFTWLGMLFAAGMGVGLVFWGVGEPLSHFQEPPPEGGEPGTMAAAEDGLLWGLFHWGLHPWSIYAIVALGLAFAKFRKYLPGLVSSAFYPVLGEKIHQWPGKAIDIIVITATTVGIATSFGMSTLQVGSGLEAVFDIQAGNVVYFVIIAVVTIIFLTSVLSGINRGMRWLSISNLTLAGVLLAAVVLLGPTLFILEHSVVTLGQYISGLPQMSLDMNPYGENEWKGDWTLFYWAWVISWSPFVGTFIARVSRGRSLQEFIIGVLFVPTLLTLMWFTAFGGTGLYAELQGNAAISDQVLQEPEAGFFLVLEQLPGSFIFSIGALILITIFFVTSANSATYVLGVFSSNGDLQPERKILLVWGLLISAIASVLLLSGGLDGMQAAATITAFPFTIIMLALLVAIYRSLRIEGEVTHNVEKKEDW